MGWRITISPTPLTVGFVDPDFDAVGHGDARGVGIDGIFRVQRVGAERLGLAIKRAQGHAHGAEELERVGAERRAAGCGRAQPREAEPVAQCAEQENFRQDRVAIPGQRGKARLHAEFVEPLLQRRSIHHPRAHVGGHRFPDPRRAQHEGRRDLAKIVQHGLGLFEEVDLHPAEQPFAEHVDLLHDPGQRQHRDVFVFRSLRIEGEIDGAMSQHAARSEHRKLRMRGRARRGAEDRDIFAARCIDEAVVERRLPRGTFAPRATSCSADIRRGSLYFRKPLGSE